MKKTKIFLGGFINYTNSQNLICRGLALHLDKAKFEVYTLSIYSGQLPLFNDKDNIHVFNCFWPLRISYYIGFLWGIWHSDVAFLSKTEVWKWNKFLLKIFKRKSFRSIDGILDQDNLKSAIEALGTYENVIDFYSYVDRSYSITKFLGEYNREHHQIKLEPRILYIGCNATAFKNEVVRTGVVKKVVFIGRLKQRKGIYDFLAIAQHFPTIEFFIFGDGEDKNAIENNIIEHQLKNVKLMGVAGHQILAEFLKDTDLHILPSRSEGFGMVTAETAAAGVPSLLYDDYGVQEWVTSGLNGWVVKTVADMIAVITDLQQHPQKLQQASNEAIKLAESFDWKIKVKAWEEEILAIHNKF